MVKCLPSKEEFYEQLLLQNKNYDPKTKFTYQLFMMHKIDPPFRGVSFGEIALLNKNSKWSVTSIASEDCQLGILNKVNFDQFIAEF